MNDLILHFLILGTFRSCAWLLWEIHCQAIEILSLKSENAELRSNTQN